MIQLMLELTVVAFFVIAVFVSSIAVPVYVLTTRGRWWWLTAFVVISFAWIWCIHWFAHGQSAQLPAQLSKAEILWNQYWWHVGVVFYQAIGLVLGILVRRQKSASMLLFAPVVTSAVWVALASVVVIFLAPQYLGQDVMTFMQTQMDQAMQQALVLVKDIPAEQQALLQQLGGQALQSSVRLLPATIWLLGLGVTSLTLFLGKWFVPRELWMKYQGSLTRWKSPAICVWLVIGLGGVYFANLYGVAMHRFMVVASNGLLGLAGVFLLQGAMIAVYYIRRQREGLFRWMWVVLIALFLQTAVVVMVLLGVFDYWADFRRIERKILL